ncbi:RIP metalloprotease RseP [Luteimonas panaciterrae]|uniref:RIP metalloprotease RseP n=1 Tax=Luteimonas panaciterrae TaxID=363885 RepID=UPI001CF94E7F|nr:RIP metalloprotease RseP [Luteimonas panaciterrae]
MLEIIGSVWWYIVGLGLLITFHEFGHFWVARRNGVKVLRFSIGFGKPLWTRIGKDGVEYVIAAIPLGGYVKMLDERETDVAPADADKAFNNKSVWRRIAIVAAGPIANLILCVVLFWAMFVVGRPDYAPVIGQVSAIAAESGLQRGDTVLEVDGRATPIWREVLMALLPDALDRKDATLRVLDAHGNERTRTLKLSRIPEGRDERAALSSIGMLARYELQPPVVGHIEQKSAAWGVLAEGDRITAIDGEPVQVFEDIGPLVQKLGARDIEAMVEVERDGDRLALPMKPRLVPGKDGNSSFWAFGIKPAKFEFPPKDAVQRYGPIEAVPAAFREMRYQTKQLFEMAARVFSGRVSVQNSIAGPITIARVANASAQQGLAWYLTVLALLSLSLGILNLLPIPLLDGGHLLYYLIELVKGSPLSERAMAAGQYVGLALLAGLMGLAFYNDILNNFVR